MEIGDYITQKIDFGKERERRTGKVVYINKKYGWYELEFELKGGKVRECFFMKELKP